MGLRTIATAAAAALTLVAAGCGRDDNGFNNQGTNNHKLSAATTARVQDAIRAIRHQCADGRASQGDVAHAVSALVEVARIYPNTLYQTGESRLAKPVDRVLRDEASKLRACGRPLLAERLSAVLGGGTGQAHGSAAKVTTGRREGGRRGDGHAPLSAAQPVPTADADSATPPLADDLKIANPKLVAPGTPRRALAEFANAWHDRDWDRMALFVTPSWAQRQDDPAAALREAFGDTRLRGYAIRRTTDTQDGTDIAAVVEYLPKVGHRLQRENVTVHLAYQDRSGRPVDEGGAWGVEPVTISTQLVG
jgi:hypothetical protein